jgi:hypothetical protein
MARNETPTRPRLPIDLEGRTHGIVIAPDPDDQERAVLEHVADIEEFVRLAHPRPLYGT